jgi:signal transduction histidine kinase
MEAGRKGEPPSLPDARGPAGATAGFGAQQAALHRIARTVAEEASPSKVFDAVAAEAAALLDADIAAIDRFDADGMVTLLAARGVTADAPTIGSRTPLGETGNAARVHATGRPARADIYTAEYSSAGYAGGFRAAVSVPILVSGGLWGVMTVASRREGDVFAPDTEERLTAMTELAALALANAQAREALAVAVDEQAALRRIAVLVATGTDLDAIFASVAEELAHVLRVDAGLVLRDELDGTVTVCAAWDTDGRAVPSGLRVRVADGALAHAVLAAGTTVRTDELAGPAESLAGLLHDHGLRAAIGSPIRVRSTPWGVALAAQRSAEALRPASTAPMEAFADLIAVAITSAEAHSALEASRARVLASADEARRRIERDLHDGAQQQLVALSLRLHTAQKLVGSDQPELAAALEHLSVGLTATLDELRELASGIRPAILNRGELEPALRVLVRRSAIPVELALDVQTRLPEWSITTVYYTVAEALTNSAKHAHAHGARVDVRELDGELRLAISDDGTGGADPSRGTGLVGLRDRVEAGGGTLSISSPAGEGTELLVRLPIVRSRRPVR